MLYPLGILLKRLGFLFGKFQTSPQANQELGGISHRLGLLHRKNLPGPQASPADRDDERLPQLFGHLARFAHGRSRRVQIRRNQHHCLQIGRSGKTRASKSRKRLDLR